MVGAIAADVCAQGAAGLATTNGDITLQNTAGNLTLNNPINAGSSTVALTSPGKVTQVAAAPIRR